MRWAEDIWNSVKQKVSNVTQKIENAIDDSISFVKDNASAVVHTALDVSEFIPVIGTAADIINVGIYVAEGDWKNAGLSALSAIPGIGDGIAAVSKSTKVVKAAKTISKVGKAANEAVGVLGSLKDAANGDFTGVITDLLFAGKGKIKSKLLDKFRSSRLGKKLLPYLDKANDWLQKAKGKIKTGANKVKEKVKQLDSKLKLSENLKYIKDKLKCKFVTGTCFTGDTLVYTKEGYIPIKTIRAGDDIYSREERTGETGFQKVEEVFHRAVHTIYIIEVNTTTKIQTTSRHPFYVEGEGWVIANQLQVGMNLQTFNGTAVITDLRKERTEEEVPVYNFRVSEWSSYFVSEWNVYVHNMEYKGNSKTGTIKQVDYGSTDLSQEAINYRKNNNITGARNVAVYEYESDGKLKTLAGASERHKGHAERLIAKKLADLGINPSQVKRIYSELEPCSTGGGYCKRFLGKVFPQADITYSFEYGVTKESRRAGVEALKEAIKSLFN